MDRLKIIFLLIPAILLIHCRILNAQQYTPTVDSLLVLIESTTGAELLDLYQELHNALYEYGDVDTHIAFNRKYVEAARANHDEPTEMYAMVLVVEAMHNYTVPDSIFFAEGWKVLDRMRGIPKAENYYYYTGTLIAQRYSLTGNHDEAIRVASRLYQEARDAGNPSGTASALRSMGIAYQSVELYDKAEESFREILTLQGKVSPGVKCDVYKSLINMLVNQERYEEGLNVCKEYEAFLVSMEDHPQHSRGDFDSFWFQNRLGYTSVYIGLEQYDVADTYLLQAVTYPVANTYLGKYSIELLRFYLSRERGHFNEAEQSLDTLGELYAVETGDENRMELMELRAELYYEWGKYDKAFEVYKDYLTVKDSVQRVEMAEKLNSLRTQYEVDKLEMRHQQQQRTFRSTVTWLTVILALLCLIVSIVIIETRRVRAKNRSLLNHIQEQDKLEKNNEQLRTELAQHERATVPGDEERDKLGDLYFRLKALMKDPEVFTDPGLNRKSLAELLGTNEKYIFDTIHTYYDMSISAYITHLRLNYARNLLALPTEKRTVETIALEAGFNSRPTFHRLFKERYGMTPDEFRRLVTGS